MSIIIFSYNCNKSLPYEVTQKLLLRIHLNILVVMNLLRMTLKAILFIVVGAVTFCRALRSYAVPVAFCIGNIQFNRYCAMRHVTRSPEGAAPAYKTGARDLKVKQCCLILAHISSCYE